LGLTVEGKRRGNLEFKSIEETNEE